MQIAIGITGASGTIYAYRLLQHLIPMLENGRVAKLAVIMTRNARDVAAHEQPELISWLGSLGQHYPGRVTEYENNDFFTPPASGSAGYSALVIVPCSMGMVGRIAGGISNDLISRAADVILKENTPAAPRTLVVCPRETPFSSIHLRNLTAIREAGGIILPASPSFYSGPRNIEELVDTVVVRILSRLGLSPEGYRGWQE